VSELFGRACLKTETGKNAANGYRGMSIFPINRNIFSEMDFSPAEEKHLKEGTSSNNVAAISPSTSCQSLV
jgi:hypothetical protein